MKDQGDYRSMTDRELLREMKEQLDKDVDWKALATVLAERLNMKGEYQ